MIRASDSRQDFSTGSIQSVGSLSGVRLAPVSFIQTRGQKFATKWFLKKASAESKSSEKSPQRRRPETSERSQLKPVIGRFGCSRSGFSTDPEIPIQSLTWEISPKGTPV